MTLFIDGHCHLDRFPSPIEIAKRAALQGVAVVAVTNLPSHFVAGLPFARTLSRVRLGLGLHPLAAADHAREWDLFERHFGTTSYISEVGLDFSREGRSTRSIQSESFRRIARMLAVTPKFVSVHSRGAERAVMEILGEFGVGAVVFHWYTGPESFVDEIVQQGHYFSVNPSMLDAASGRSIIERIPRERVLTESDGPFAQFRGAPAQPWDVRVVVEHLASRWGCSTEEAKASVWRNLWSLLRRLPGGRAEGGGNV